MRGDEAKQICPSIQLVQVPVAHSKADLNIYRRAGSEVVSILARKGLCERASIDEVYLDLTDAAEKMLVDNPPHSWEAIHEEALKSHILGLNEDGNAAHENVREWLQRRDADHRSKLLACGALIVAELRLQVLQETEFTCSAGIAHNKMLAKLVSGMNKPAQQTVVPFSSVKRFLETLPIKKMKLLGGKLGSSLQMDLNVNTVGDLLQFSEERLQELYGVNTGTWLWNIARGINGEEVQGRLLPKSHGSGKTFPGPRALKTTASVEHWLNELCEDLSERLHSDLDQNKRIAQTLTLHVTAHKFGDSDSHKKFPSKSCSLRYGIAKIQEDARNLFLAGLREYLGSHSVKARNSEHSRWGITALSVSASKLIAIPSGTCSITKYFHGQEQSLSSSEQSNGRSILEAGPSSAFGSGSHSGLCLTEAKIELCGEETRTMNARMSLDEDTRKLWKEQAENGFALETLLVSSSDEPQMEFTEKKTKIMQAPNGMKRHAQKRKILKEKGTPSILRFFHNHNSCSSNQVHIETLQETTASNYGVPLIPSSCSDLIKAELPQQASPPETCISAPETQTNTGMYGVGRNELQRDAWSYNIDEIDLSVIDELPEEIQKEVRAILRPQKRANLAKRGSSIAHYFLPART